MAKMKQLKKSLITSCLALTLSFSTLVGTTFAWFTDSVTSANNIIKSGNLDVDVYYGDPAEKNSIASVDTLFGAVKLWEPGAFAYENITVANEGSLALKYEMSVNFTNENYVIDGDYRLSDILKVGLVNGALSENMTRDEAIADVDTWMAMETFSFDTILQAHTLDDTFAIVIYWEPTAEDDNYNVNNGKETNDGKDYLHIDLGINVVAKQTTYEEDSFDDQYDKEATYPVITSGTLQEGASEGLTLKIDKVTVTVPQGAPAGTYTLEMNSFDAQGEGLGDANVNTNIALKKDGVNVAPDSAEYNVTIELQPMVDILGVTHNGETVTNYTYDVFKKDISFNTTSFSPFAVEYDVFGTALELDVENRKILGGFFTKDPSIEGLDPSLLGNDSEGLIVKNGAQYIVSKRSTTVFFGETASTYTLDKYSEPVTVQGVAGKMYKAISDLSTNEHSTVYILPGTYNEATTIYVYSSMDIIGLGNKDDINIVKMQSSYSNRHLINCTGTKADYIQVNISNMTLDATANSLNKNGTSYSQDNAAVQSIRKSKVKCYDLNIIKTANNMASIAFYVNGNNAVDGVKYPAYLYAENCTLNSTKSFSVVSTAGSYKFYHTNLTYGGTLYTTNNTSTKNKTMAWDEWEW